MRITRRILRIFDLTSYWSGQLFSWLVLGIVFVLFYEVITRYFFDSPNKWSYDMGYYIGGSFVALGLCYVTLNKGHVRIDLFYMRFSRKVQLWVDIIFTLCFFFPIWGIFTRVSWQKFFFAIKTGEVSDYGYWYPPFWPIRLSVAIGMTLLMIAGLSWLIKSICELRTGEVEKTGLEEIPQ
ncbi:TRAP transporter small permease subunit [Chloroflexota bacterium]